MRCAAFARRARSRSLRSLIGTASESPPSSLSTTHLPWRSSCRPSPTRALRRARVERWASSTSANHHDYAALRRSRHDDIQQLAEVKASKQLEAFLVSAEDDASIDHHAPLDSTQVVHGPPTSMSPREVRLVLDAMLATFCLHVESRIASMLGVGYYTIGPCGEEALASAALALQHPSDSVALHYRHLGINVARLLLRQQQAYEPIQSSLSQLLLDRARGYAVSRHDPVTSGVHCSLGSSSHHSSGDSTLLGGDFIVTSTLASQCSPAVGRALAYGMLSPNGRHPSPQGGRRRPVSFVTVGDGSVHNAHFWSAFHLARHARHRGVKCPVVFGVADNGLSISYETRGYVDTLFANDPLVPLFVANGGDAWDVHEATSRAVAHARTRSAPAVVLFKNLIRRFGHAATDRQASYLAESQIQMMAQNDVLERNIARAASMGVATYPELLRRFREIQEATAAAFEAAVNEPKVDREDMLRRVAAPAVPIPRLSEAILCRSLASDNDATAAPRKEMTRKLMNRVIGEALESDPSVVYMGEDVRHGGYYAVTEGLVAQFPSRVVDFPPDETSLLGSALGFAQCGFIPIVEIPYAKYLDCGADMFAEIALSHWLEGESRRHSGMLIRLQGFDRGLFGGNFHTHNSLTPPPGVDMLCYSNGEDYVRGFRNAMIQAKAGRVVVLVDCTHLLNLRHVFDKDRAWERPYPPNDEHGLMNFDDVRQFGKTGNVAIVTYGTGVVTALQARKALHESREIESESYVDIIDCPCLSRVPSGLSEAIGRYSGVVFADICKSGPGTSVLSSAAVSLHDQGKLPAAWRSIAAPRTYNPLGNMSTFLNVTDIVESTRDVLTCIRKGADKYKEG